MMYRVKSTAAILVLIAALVGGCGGGGGGIATPRERPGVFVTRILREEINGQWALQWDELHPAHKRLISRAAYVACSHEMATNIGVGKEVFHVLDLREEPIHVLGVPQRVSKLVTISFNVRGASQALRYRLHAVDVNGRWAWILGGRFLAQVARGRCLDGSPLRAGR